MIDLLGINASSDDASRNHLVEVKLYDEAAMLVLFTSDADEAAVHYEQDEGSRGYILCLGKGCPFCEIGKRASQVILLPAYNIETRRVDVLRISRTTGPGTLMSGIRAHLGAPNVHDLILVVTKVADRYETKSVPLTDAIDRGDGAIRRFKDLSASGEVDLKSIFRRMSRAEILAIPRVETKLRALGRLDEAPATSEPKNPTLDENEPF